jgi:hypothetical protein
MDLARVQSAWALMPHTVGEFVWHGDSTLLFTPDSLQGGLEYSLVIGAEACSSAGESLEEPFRLRFTVSAPPSVVQVIPAPGSTDVPLEAPVTVVFDRPMVPLVTTDTLPFLPVPCTFDPPLEGKGEWVSSATYVFRPAPLLVGGITYSVGVQADLADLEGNALSIPYSWSFKTVAPKLQQVLEQRPKEERERKLENNAANVWLDSAFIFIFNQAMDVESVTAALTLLNLATGLLVPGSIITDATALTGESAVFVFSPDGQLDVEGQYQFVVDRSTCNTHGVRLEAPYTATFTTTPRPKVIKVSPQDGEQTSTQEVTFLFGVPMDSSTFNGRVHIVPQPDRLDIQDSLSGRLWVDGHVEHELSLSFAARPDTTYTVKLDAGLADIFGNVVTEPTVLGFTYIEPLPEPHVNFVPDVARRYARAHIQDDTAIKVEAANVDRVSVTLSTLDEDEMISLLWPNSEQEADDDVPPPATTTWELPLETNPKKVQHFTLGADQDSGKSVLPGTYLLSARASISRQDDQGQEAGPEGLPWRISRHRQARLSVRQLYIVATLNLTLKLARREVLVWATDLQSGQAVEGVQVRVRCVKGQAVVCSGTTDAHGLMRAACQVDLAETYVAVATGADVFGLASSGWQCFDPDSSQIEESEEERLRGFDAHLTPGIYIYTDQLIYRPGHPVYFRAIVRDIDDILCSVPSSKGAQVTISQTQQDEHYLFQEQVILSAYGTLSGCYQLPLDARLGKYVVQVEYAGRKSAVNFHVAEFRPPEFLVSATPETTEVVSGDVIRLVVEAKFVFGTPVSGGKVRWEVRSVSQPFAYRGAGNYAFSAYAPSLQKNQPTQRDEAILDGAGRAILEIPSDLVESLSTQLLIVEVSLSDESGQFVSTRAEVVVHPADVYVGLNASTCIGAEGQPLSIELITVDRQSGPQARQTIEIEIARITWEVNQTAGRWERKALPVGSATAFAGEDGRARYTFVPPQAGSFQIEATTRDTRGRQSASAVQVFSGIWKKSAYRWLLIESDTTLARLRPS